MNDRLTCLLCPIGCELEVEADGGDVRVLGHQCDKGIDFAAEEILRPTAELGHIRAVGGNGRPDGLGPV